jgi:hypothetical protein
VGSGDRAAAWATGMLEDIGILHTAEGTRPRS